MVANFKHSTLDAKHALFIRYVNLRAFSLGCFYDVTGMCSIKLELLVQYLCIINLY